MKPRSIICATCCLLASGVLSTLLGCSSKDDAIENEHANKTAQQPERSGITLTTEEIRNAGVAIKAVESATYTPEVHGFAIVIAHDVIAQSVSETITAEAAARQSKAALQRIEGLAQTPGAFSAETLEAARHQAQADEAAYVFARRKLSASWGEQSPWGEDAYNNVLTNVASGKTHLIRVTFPIGTLNGSAPQQLTFSSLGLRDTATSPTSSTVWNAPADASIPGRSLFALVSDASFSEGERLDVSAPSGKGVSGSVVPASAIVIYNAQGWCYVENPSGHFERRPIDTRLSTKAGYFSESAVKPGEHVATSGASLLLAREINPNTEADD